jgi:transcriptional regulator with GAF, ATPase, and Fis domain
VAVPAVIPCLNGEETLLTCIEKAFRNVMAIERDAIVKALKKARYNKTAAAKLLGMSFWRTLLLTRSQPTWLR